MAIRRTVYFSGRVQGVGFRFMTVHIAANHDVGGTVRNLPDGRVEVVAEGEPEELERFIGAVRRELGTYISALSAIESPASESFKGFDIAY
ncbi:MAG TPA: acylphosphatase [Phycisphaerae bacterium]|nr:acylphosphatase [Phycisphaerae bacterium]